MTPDQILAAFPKEAQKPKGLDSYGDQMILVEIPHFEVGGGVFKVNFAFNSGKLALIRLHCSPPSAADAMKLHAMVLGLLSEKYGPPLSSTRDAANADSEWRTAMARVSLNWMHLDSMGDNDVTISYAPPVAAERDRL